jgi:hypothetical protein
LRLGQLRESQAYQRCRRSSPQHPRHRRRHLALKVPRHQALKVTALGQETTRPSVQRQAFTASGLRLLAFLEYDVEYAVRDIESLLFWLRGLDGVHADLDGSAALASAAALNRVLAGNVDARGFVTNEHRYLAVASHGRKIG